MILAFICILTMIKRKSIILYIAWQVYTRFYFRFITYFSGRMLLRISLL